MPTPPAVLIFDVNETLSDMSPLAERFVELGAPAALARTWFAALLRDGFALTCAGAQEPFARLAREGLAMALSGLLTGAELERGVEFVMDGFTSLPVHPDVVPGVEVLHAAGLRLVTLSNGAASVAEGLLARAGVRPLFEQVLSVEDAGAWKPAAQAYGYAAERCGVPLEQTMLVAVHPWDTDGAQRAGAGAAYLDRTGSGYPGYFLPPQLRVSSLTELAEVLAG